MVGAIALISLGLLISISITRKSNSIREYIHKWESGNLAELIEMKSKDKFVSKKITSEMAKGSTELSATTQKIIASAEQIEFSTKKLAQNANEGEKIDYEFNTAS